MTTTLTELQTAHPSGVYSERHGCYYTMDYDNEVGFFRQLNNGSFEAEWNWTDFDTMSEEEAEYVCGLAKQISLAM